MNNMYMWTNIAIPVSFYLIFGQYAELLCNLISFVSPLYASIKSIETYSSTDHALWITCWMIFGLFNVFKPVEIFISTWFPFYWLCKCFLFLCLWGGVSDIDFTDDKTSNEADLKNAEKLYMKIIHPGYMKIRHQLNQPDLERLLYSNAVSITLVVLGYVTVGNHAEFVCNLYGYLFPAYMMIKEIESSSRLDVTQWLPYWMVFGLFHVLNFMEEKIAEWIPAYWFCKCILLLYLFMPWTAGARKLFYDAIHPVFVVYERSPHATPENTWNVRMMAFHTMFALYLIFGNYAKTMCNLVGFAYPAYASIKSIQSPSSTADTQWISYWILFGLVQVLQSVEVNIITWFPAYWLCKWLGLRYLYAPETMGAQKIYYDVIVPALYEIQHLIRPEVESIVDKNAISVCGFALVYMIFGFYARLVCNLVGFLYPTYLMTKDMRLVSRVNDMHWLMYWMIFGLFSVISPIEEKIDEWIPVYWFGKCIFLLYLFLPWTMGAQKIFMKIIYPVFLQDHRHIHANNVHENADEGVSRNDDTDIQKKQIRVAGTGHHCCICQENDKTVRGSPAITCACADDALM